MTDLHPTPKREPRRLGTKSIQLGVLSLAALAAWTLAYVLWRERMIARPAAAALAAVPTLLIGTSRVYLDIHWSTDVLGGWALGALVTALSAITYEHIRTDTRERGAPARSRWQG